MNREDLKNKLKAFAVEMLSSFKQTEMAFTDAKLADGTIVSYDGDLKIGAILMIVDESGQKLPMPMGNYVLEDGTEIEVVDNMGTVGEVKAAGQAPEATPAMPQEQAAAPTAAARTDASGQPIPTSVVETRVKETKFNSQEEVELHIEQLEEKFSKQIQAEKEEKETFKVEVSKEVNELKDLVKSQDELLKEMFTLISRLGDAPAVKPTETKTNVFNVKAWREEFKADLRKIQENINQ